MMIESIFTLCVFGAVAIGLWAARSTYANFRTYEQRLAMIDSWEGMTHENYLSELRSFRSVSYSAHQSEVFWGRDPYLLYPHLRVKA